MKRAFDIMFLGFLFLASVARAEFYENFGTSPSVGTLSSDWFTAYSAYQRPYYTKNGRVYTSGNMQSWGDKLSAVMLQGWNLRDSLQSISYSLDDQKGLTIAALRARVHTQGQYEAFVYCGTARDLLRPLSPATRKCMVGIERARILNGKWEYKLLSTLSLPPDHVAGKLLFSVYDSGGVTILNVSVGNQLLRGVDNAFVGYSGQGGFLLQGYDSNGKPTAASIDEYSMRPTHDIQFVHRGYRSGDHLMTLNEREFYNGGYRNEGIRLITWKEGFPSAQGQIYRCRINGTDLHFVSMAPNCEGQRTEGSLGYVSTKPLPGLSPIYRFGSREGDHLTTLHHSEGVAAGFVYEGILGWVMP